MTVQQRADKAVAALEKEYPTFALDLVFDQPYKLLFATRLAAQSTDDCVNMVTKPLYETYPTLKSIADAKPKDIENIIRPCGLGPTKSRDLVAAAQRLLAVYDGKVPDTMDELLTLPGIGRKTANLILGDVFGKPAIVVDTHCLRITNLLGIADSKYPDTVERQLADVLDPEKSNDFCHRLVHHGRAVCVARNPQCQRCVMASFCEYALSQPEKKS